MANWREGERVRIVTRPVSEEDRKTNRYFDHMAGLTGTIQNIYSAEEIAIKVDPDCMSRVTKDVHGVAVDRMREKFLNAVSDEQKKQLTQEEINFNANYVLLVRSEDLEKAS
jgi:phosphate uptake regulator